MSTPSFPAGDPKYYDPAEVEAYVNDATTTIRTLQARLADAARRADEAEQALGDCQPEAASLGRALLLASEVADKTVAEAEAHAAEIVRAASEQAAAIIATAELEAHHLVDAAHGAATDIFRDGEARLMAAVSAFVEGSTVLREELAKVGEDAARWRAGSSPQDGVDHEPHTFAAPEISEISEPPEMQVPIKVSPFFPPRPPVSEADSRQPVGD